MHLKSSPAFLVNHSKQSVKKILWLGLALAAVSFLVLGRSGPAVVRAACAGGYGVNFVQPNSSPIALATGATPFSLARGDFNGDNKLDLAVANYGNNNVSILLGNGLGGFTPANSGPFGVGSHPISIAVGDFNKDTHLDLVTANNGDSSLSVLLNDGMGGFAAAVPLTAGQFPYAVVVADFDGDNNLDLAVVNGGSSDVNVLIGNGSGGFTGVNGSPFGIGTGANFPLSLGVGDFNGDGKLDLVTANGGSNNISILLNNGAGGFIPPNNPIGVGHNPNSVIVADFNTDLKPDLAVTNQNDNNITVLLNSGANGLIPATNSPFSIGAGSSPSAIITGDFNGDGKLDLATANSGTTYNNVSILVGDNTGSFNLANGGSFGVDTSPFSVVTGDFNSDGKPDLATANYGSSSVSVLLNHPILTVSSLQLIAPASATAGTPLTVTVTALDNCGDTFTGYTGTVAFSSSDTVADLPANSTLDNGTKTFTGGVKFYTGGSRSLTVTDTLSNTLTASQNVTVTNFVVTANSDPAGASPPMGTLSYALKNVSPTNGQLITFKPGVTAVNVTGQLPDVPAGVTINGGSCTSGTPVFINSAGGTGDGLVLKGGVTLQNLRVANFPGRQIVAGVTPGGKNTLVCTKTSKSFT